MQEFQLREQLERTWLLSRVHFEELVPNFGIAILHAFKLFDYLSFECHVLVASP
jgi:hypothetical protein